MSRRRKRIPGPATAEVALVDVKVNVVCVHAVTSGSPRLVSQITFK